LSARDLKKTPDPVAPALRRPHSKEGDPDRPTSGPPRIGSRLLDDDAAAIKDEAKCKVGYIEQVAVIEIVGVDTIVHKHDSLVVTVKYRPVTSWN
jgi:hypothetical protein